jgi:hypothetical protein
LIARLTAFGHSGEGYGMMRESRSLTSLSVNIAEIDGYVRRFLLVGARRTNPAFGGFRA